MRRPPSDEDDVRQIESAYDHAWTNGDVDALTDCFTTDAVVVNPRGEVANGIEEIRTHLGAFLQGPAHGSRHEGRVLRITFPTPDVAVVDGEARIVPANSEDPTLTHRFTDVLVRQDGVWRLAHVRAYYQGR